MNTAHNLIRELLDHLPDNMRHTHDESWQWCWDELSGPAQEQVKHVRERATTFLINEIAALAEQIQPPPGKEES